MHYIIIIIKGYLGLGEVGGTVFGNLRRLKKKTGSFCVFGGLGVWGNFLQNNFRRHPIYEYATILHIYFFISNQKISIFFKLY